MRCRRVQYCRKRLRCRCFRDSHIDHRDAVELKATDRYQQKADCVDSESCFLATKKFLWFWPGIGPSLAKTAFCASRRRRFGGPDFHRDDASMHARPSIEAAAITPAPRQRAVQTPSLALSRSLTACGLALPPDDFITWPTNQPISCGLARACATLSGLP